MRGAGVGGGGGHVPLHQTLPTHALIMDASDQGWGAVCGHHT